MGRQRKAVGGSLKIGRRPTSPPVAADLAVRVESSPWGRAAKLPPTARGKPPGDRGAAGIQKEPSQVQVCAFRGLTAASPAAFQGPFDPRHYAK